jgi:hypothetical protein
MRCSQLHLLVAGEAGVNVCQKRLFEHEPQRGRILHLEVRCVRPFREGRPNVAYVLERIQIPGICRSTGNIFDESLRRKSSTIPLPVEMGPRERVPQLGSYAGIPCPGVKARMAVKHVKEGVRGREMVRRAKAQGKAQEQLLQGKE